MAADRSTRPRRRRFDDWDPDSDTPPRVAARRRRPAPDDAGHGADESTGDSTTYPAATRGPQPVPAWVVTDPQARDVDLGVLKTGKEAELSLVRRAVAPGVAVSDDGARVSLLAAKRYRSAEHRLFHRDADYLEGRRVRKSREMRAIGTRTGFGKQLIADLWAGAEFDVLARLWQAGVAVPYPVQRLGTELLIEFIGDTDGHAAPRLAETKPSAAAARSWYEQLVDALTGVAEAGLAHGDLSAYNVLVEPGTDRIVLIDLPQAVDVAGNPHGLDFLRRDCANITAWFAARGVSADPEALFVHLAGRIH